LDSAKLPQHVAIIMDGNGRWAKKRLLNRIKGHEKGAETVRTIVRTSREIGIPVLTLYAFSTENWQRPKAEVIALMTLLKKFLESELPELVDNNIRLKTIGQIERLPDDVLKTLRQTMAQTQDMDGMILNLALSYGARSEIIDMVKQIGLKLRDGELGADDVTEDLVARNLFTSGLPDPDLLIRTSGEMRISNFLLWQIAYTELAITKTLWPDFNREEYLQILKDYQMRDRRYGKVGV
jgi:undecaprenyl diphosphate synthase